MLQAIIRHRGRQRRDLRRDEVTSLVFGGLAYVPAADAWPVFRDLLAAGGGRTPAPGWRPDGWRLEFWPHQGPGQGHDLAATFRDPAGVALAVLADIAWGPRTGRARLPAPGGDRIDRYLLVVGDSGPVLDIAAERGGALSWARFAEALTCGRRHWPRGGSLWAADVLELLACLNVQPFSGFGGIRTGAALRPGRRVFWHPFTGFAALSGRYPLTPQRRHTVFFHPMSHRGDRTLH
ncbi:MAG TPA: hypothetical protein VFA95_02855 [Gammaproteobacteria bacterium]|nr:hypothetical protein [Gammaproteobacteria bacterium]